MRNISQISQRYEWNLVTRKGKFKGIDVTYDGNVDKNIAFEVCAETFGKYNLQTEIRSMRAYLLGIPVEVKDTSLENFERRYRQEHLRIEYLDMWGKKPSLKAKFCGILPPYVWVNVGCVNMSMWFRDLDLSTALEILRTLSQELSLGIQTELMERDIKDFKELRPSVIWLPAKVSLRLDQ